MEFKVFGGGGCIIIQNWTELFLLIYFPLAVLKRSNISTSSIIIFIHCNFLHVFMSALPSLT